MIILPPNVGSIIKKLQNAGFDAYAVGGCVRDVLLGKTPHDWDITTDAKPNEVKKLFRRTIDTGIQHGTVTVMIKDEAGKLTGYEVTTYRIDGEYEDSRHPKEVTYTADLKEDLRRRDFTINAMAYNDRSGLIDIFGGKKDLEEQIIRAVGDPAERFSEDALRILRAYRFAAQLGFRIEAATVLAASGLKENLLNISAERIQAEFTKLICSPHPEILYDMHLNGISSVILPELDLCMETEQKNKHHLYTVGEHTIKAMIVNAKYSGVDFDGETLKYIRYAILFHDFGKPEVMTEDESGSRHFKGHAEASVKIAKSIMKRLKLDNNTINMVCALVKWHDFRPVAERKSVRKAVNKVGEDVFRLLFSIRIADTLAQSMYHRQEKLAYEKSIMQIYKEIIEDKDPITLKDLAVTGSDLIAHGYRPGPAIGEKLNELLNIVLEDPSCNSKEILLSKI